MYLVEQITWPSRHQTLRKSSFVVNFFLILWITIYCLFMDNYCWDNFVFWNYLYLKVALCWYFFVLFLLFFLQHFLYRFFFCEVRKTALLYIFPKFQGLHWKLERVHVPLIILILIIFFYQNANFFWWISFNFKI